MKKIPLALFTLCVWFSLILAAGRPVRAAGLITYRGGVFVEGKGISFVFDAPGYRNRDVRSASIFVASNFHDLGCTVNREEAKIVCVLRGGLTEHAGETGIIHLAGQIFYVTIPGRSEPEAAAEEYWEGDGGMGELVSCGEMGTGVLGAWVTFEYLEEESYFYEEFIGGESLESIEATVLEMAGADEAILSYEIGEFGCYEVNEEAGEY